jgi:hypothetical protein
MTATIIGTIRAVVAVFEINKDKIDVAVIKPSKSLRGLGPVTNNTLKATRSWKLLASTAKSIKRYASTLKNCLIVFRFIMCLVLILYGNLLHVQAEVGGEVLYQFNHEILAP